MTPPEPPTKRGRIPTRLSPFRTPPLSGPDVGWLRPFFAVVLAILGPSLLAGVFIYNGAPVFSGPPKDGSGYSWGDHVAIVLACLAASVVVTWMMVPLSVMGLRATAMLGYAGWGTAILAALIVGLPVAHVLLNGDLTTEENAILPHLMVALGVLGLSHWAAFWGLMSVRKRPLSEKPEFSR